jgi:restriction endonuclease Mrr
MNSLITPIILLMTFAIIFFPIVIIYPEFVKFISVIFTIYIMISFFGLPIYYILKLINKNQKNYLHESKLEIEQIEEDQGVEFKLDSTKNVFKMYINNINRSNSNLNQNLNRIKTQKKYLLNLEEKLISNQTPGVPFKDSENYVLIKNFALRYTNNYSEDSLAQLLRVINNKGCNLSLDELKNMLNNELQAIEYSNFKTKIMSLNLKTYDAFAHAFIDIFPENYDKKIDFFEKLIDDVDIKQNKNDTKYNLDKIKLIIQDEFFEKKLMEKNYENLNVNQLKTLNGHQFEEFLVKLFDSMGYKSKKTKGSGDQGADLILEKFGETTVVQAKNYSNKVNNKSVQEVVASIKHYKADKGMVVTTNYFQKSAEELAKSNNIELIDYPKLKKLIEEYL